MSASPPAPRWGDGEAQSFAALNPSGVAIIKSFMFCSCCEVHKKLLEKRQNRGVHFQWRYISSKGDMLKHIERERDCK